MKKDLIGNETRGECSRCKSDYDKEDMCDGWGQCLYCIHELKKWGEYEEFE